MIRLYNRRTCLTRFHSVLTVLTSCVSFGIDQGHEFIESLVIASAPLMKQLSDGFERGCRHHTFTKEACNCMRMRPSFQTHQAESMNNSRRF